MSKKLCNVLCLLRVSRPPRGAAACRGDPTHLLFPQSLRNRKTETGESLQRPHYLDFQSELQGLEEVPRHNSRSCLLKNKKIFACFSRLDLFLRNRLDTLNVPRAVRARIQNLDVAASERAFTRFDHLETTWREKVLLNRCFAMLVYIPPRENDPMSRH